MTVSHPTRAAFGDPNGPTALFLHGYTDSSFSFSPLAAFPARYRAIVPDQRGHGARATEDGPVGRRALARDAIATLDAAGVVGPIAVVGHSLGALTALRIAADHPERVSRLVLIGGAAGAAGNPALTGLADEIAGLSGAPDGDFIRAFQQSTAAEPLPPAFLERVIAASSLVPPRVWREALADLLDPEQDVSPTRVRVPILAIWGDRDGVFGPDARRALLDAAPDIRALVLPGVGHAPHWERPAEVASALDRFIAGPADAAARERR